MQSAMPPMVAITRTHIRINMKSQIANVTYTFFLILLFTWTMCAQDYEYGKPAELKGLTKVFIDAGPDVNAYNDLKDTIVDAKIAQLVFVTKVAESDFVILFRGSREPMRTGTATKEFNTGKGFVGIPSADGQRVRLLLNVESTQNRLGEKRPAIKLAKEFIKAYKTANDIK